VRAGPWIFGTGLRGDDPQLLFQRIEKELNESGSSMSLVARLDQYYPDARCVAPYQAARKQAFAGRQVAPSTSVIVGGLRDAKAVVDVQVVAAAADSGYVLQEVGTGLNRPEASGYAPCLRAGDLVFVAGQLARDAAGRLAARGTAAETEYIFRQRLIPALEGAGSRPELVLKAQAYLSRPHEVSEFNETWENIFAGGVPPTTVVPVRHPAFLTPEATVEINVIAAHRSAADRVRAVDCEVPARVLDGLLFPAALGGSGMDHIMARARRVFEAAGTDLSSVIRALVFHSDSHGFAGSPFPFTAVQVHSELTVDLWGYVPQP
jgi:enamine deaminase RidA (YjgF/YER057c/UK114 family)